MEIENPREEQPMHVGSPLNIKNKDGNTALQQCIINYNNSRDDVDLMEAEILLRDGADINTLIFFALAVPLDDPRSTKSISVAFFFEANYKLPNDEGDATRRERRSSNQLDRRTVYRTLESKFQRLGYPGRECLLRCICETARDRQHLARNGLVGDLLRIVLTPSTSEDEGLAEVYRQAETIGDAAAAAAATEECASTYQLCPLSIYQHISDTVLATAAAAEG